MTEHCAAAKKRNPACAADAVRPTSWLAIDAVEARLLGDRAQRR